MRTQNANKFEPSGLPLATINRIVKTIHVARASAVFVCLSHNNIRFSVDTRCCAYEVCPAFSQLIRIAQAIRKRMAHGKLNHWPICQTKNTAVNIMCVVVCVAAVSCTTSEFPDIFPIQICGGYKTVMCGYPPISVYCLFVSRIVGGRTSWNPLSIYKCRMQMQTAFYCILLHSVPSSPISPIIEIWWIPFHARAIPKRTLKKRKSLPACLCPLARRCFSGFPYDSAPEHIYTHHSMSHSI